MFFLNLPTLVIQQILSFFPLRDRLKLRLISPLWSALVFSNVTEFAVGNRELATLDRHFPMRDHFFCDDELDRLRGVVFLLKKTKHCLVKLHLSFIDGQNLEQKSEEFNQQVDEMIFLLIQCSRLTCLRFDYGFRLPKAKYELILRHLGTQLVEFYCEDSSSWEFSHEFAMKYLNPIKAKILSVDYGKSNIEFQQFLEKFPYLTFFKDFSGQLKPHSLKHLSNLTEFCAAFPNNLLPEIAKSAFAPNLVFYQFRGLEILEPDIDLYKNLRSLRFLFVRDLSNINRLLQNLPQLVVFVCRLYLCNSLLNQISKMKKLKVLDVLWSPRDLELNLDPILNVEFLLLTTFFPSTDLHDGTAWEKIASVFPNLKCLDIHCSFYQPEPFLASLARLPKLRRLRLHTRNPKEEGAQYTVEESFLARQQIKSFCARNQIEFLWSHFDWELRRNKFLCIKNFRSFRPTRYSVTGANWYLRQFPDVVRTLPHFNSFDWL